jgi:hypothetical protein
MNKGGGIGKFGIAGCGKFFPRVKGNLGKRGCPIGGGIRPGAGGK